MQELTLEFQKREVLGKAVKRVRKEGFVPAVIHDHGKPSVAVQIEYQQMAKAYQAAGKHHPLKLDGTHKYTALIKNITFDPKKNSITHVVFNAVKANEKVTADIPVHVTFDEGNDASPAERAGLIVLHQAEAVQVEALAKDLPDALTFNGEKLIEVGDHATVADLVVPAGVTIKTEPTQVLATVFEPSALQAANDAAGGTDEEDENAEAEEGEGEGETPAAEEGAAATEADSGEQKPE